MSPATRNPARDALTALGLVALTLAVYAQSFGHDFVGFDDDSLILENPWVLSGLTSRSLADAFAVRGPGPWHPLAWLSHMADVEFFGLNPAGHHAVSVLLHVLASVLLWLALRRLTGSHWRSALVAAVFALHPVQVESVAWVSERKTVLSGALGFWALWLYAGYARAPSWRGYAGVTLAFALALMAKPMVVTLPFVLLLLDYWPLRRHERDGKGDGAPRVSWRRAGWLVAEKLPLLAMAAISSYLTVQAQIDAGAIAAGERFTWWLRISNALLSYLRYLRDAVFPLRLAAFYPYPASIPAWQAAGAAALLLAVTALAVAQVRRRPHLAVGWLWYLGTLVPMIGVIQVGVQSHADRYLYLPIVGLMLMVAWSLPAWRSLSPGGRGALLGSTAAGLAVLLVLSVQQAAVWRNRLTLWTHAVAVTRHNDRAHLNLGVALIHLGQVEQGVAHLRRAAEIGPGRVKARLNLALGLLRLGELVEAERVARAAIELDRQNSQSHHILALILQRQDRLEEAIRQHEQAAALAPRRAELHHALALALAAAGRLEPALERLQRALEIRPDWAEAHNDLGVTLDRLGRAERARVAYQQALHLDPAHVQAHENLGNLHLAQGEPARAAEHYRRALALAPPSAQRHTQLAIALWQSRDGGAAAAEAEQQFRAALALDDTDARAHNHLGILLGTTGRLEEARAHFQRAVELRPDYGEARRNLEKVQTLDRD